jgi:hypothetical protein
MAWVHLLKIKGVFFLKKGAIFQDTYVVAQAYNDIIF